MKGYHQAWRWSCDPTAASETLVPYSDLGLPWPKSPHQAQVRLALLLKAAPASPQPLQPAFPSWTPMHNPGHHSLGPRGPRPATSQVFLEPPEQARAPVCICWMVLPVPAPTPFLPHPQATTFQRNLPSMCSTRRPATPFLPEPRPSEWTAPQVRHSPDGPWLTGSRIPGRAGEGGWPDGGGGSGHRIPSSLRLGTCTPDRPRCLHAARGDGAPHCRQGLPARLLHQGPQQAGQLQRRPVQGKGHPARAEHCLPPRETAHRAPSPRT